MPSRRSFGRRRSAPRRKTRWLSIIPGVLVNTGVNDTWAYSQLALQDVQSGTATPVSWGEFYGGTLIRTILDVTFDPIWGTISGANEEETLIDHVGVFMADVSIPSQTYWDPNVPSGDFMHRHTWAASFVSRAGVTATLAQPEVNVHMDIKTRRRIQENEQLFAVHHYFERLGGGGNAALQAGYTGRVLILLP